MSTDALKPSVKRITDIIVTLRGSPTDVASGSMPATVVAMDSAADGAVGSCMVTYPSCSRDPLDAKAPTQCCAEVAVIQRGSASIRNEVGTCSGA